MNSYLRPVLADPAIRHDGRKVIGSVSARFSRAAGDQLAAQFAKPVLLAWAADTASSRSPTHSGTRPG